ncbi:beta-galactosidase, partial [Paraburkholderia dipogonis]|uniref:beta-galactosidase n=1 Tax=Paraburkholderia dipogonis TaxID=1211383 RepID=UPI0035E5897D
GSEKRVGCAAGTPDFASFNHDVYRGMSKLPRSGVMEQQPGPVNWALWNPGRRCRAWCGCGVGRRSRMVRAAVSVFSAGGQAPFAQEQMHAGLNTPDNRLDVGGSEAAQVAGEISHGARSECRRNAAVRSKVALIYDYEAKWLFEIHRGRGADFHYPRFAFEYTAALARAWAATWISCRLTRPLDGYSLTRPCRPLPVVPRGVLRSVLASSGAQVVLGPRTGSKTHVFADSGEPAARRADFAVLPVRVWRVESMRPNVTDSRAAR